VHADGFDAAAQAAHPGVSYPSEQQDPILPMQPTGFMRPVFKRS